MYFGCFHLAKTIPGDLTFPNFSLKMRRNVRKGGDRAMRIKLRKTGARRAFSGNGKAGYDSAVMPFSLAAAKG